MITATQRYLVQLAMEVESGNSCPPSEEREKEQKPCQLSRSVHQKKTIRMLSEKGPTVRRKFQSDILTGGTIDPGCNEGNLESSENVDEPDHEYSGERVEDEDDTTGQLSRSVHQKKTIRMLSEKGPTVRRKFQCDILTGGTIDPGCNEGNLESRENVDEPDHEYSGERVEDEDDTTGQLSRSVHQKKTIRMLSEKGPTVRRKFQCDILAGGTIDPGCNEGNLESRENVDEPDHEYSGERVEDEDDTTGTKSVGFEDSFDRRRQPLGIRNREKCEERDPLVHDDVCVDKLCRTEKDRTRTSRNKNIIEYNTDEMSFICPDCSYKANRQSRIRMHMDAVHPEKKLHKCPHCNHKTTEISDLKTHINALHYGLKPYKCADCDYSASNYKNLIMHIDSVHLKKKPQRCPHCDYIATQSFYLKTHIDSVHLKKKLHRCPHCDYSTTRASDFKTHIDSVHFVKKPHRCPHCDYRTTQSSYLKTHIDSVHLVKKPHRCPHCDYRTTQASDLKTHINASHDGIKPYRCADCDYSTSYYKNLITHIDSVHWVKKPHKCPHCGYRTTQSSYLKTHIDSVHLVIKPFSCPHCDYRAIYLSHIMTHINSVHLEKIHRCPHCDYRTAWASYLETHIDSVHLVIKPYRCSHCDYRATYLSHLKTHIDTVHLVMKFYKCRHCGYAATQKLHLKNHKCPTHRK